MLLVTSAWPPHTAARFEPQMYIRELLAVSVTKYASLPILKQTANQCVEEIMRLTEKRMQNFPGFCNEVQSTGRPLFEA